MLIKEMDDLSLVTDTSSNLEKVGPAIFNLELPIICGVTYVPVDVILDVTPDDSFFRMTFESYDEENEMITLRVSRSYLEDLDRQLFSILASLGML